MKDKIEGILNKRLYGNVIGIPAAAEAISELFAEQIDRIKEQANAMIHEQGLSMSAQIGELEAENAKLKAILYDENALHINLLRGNEIRLSREKCLHLASATDYDALKEENAKLKARVEYLEGDKALDIIRRAAEGLQPEKDLATLAGERFALEKENARLRDALEVYADINNWGSDSADYRGYVRDVFLAVKGADDGFTLAREVLEEK